jgi:transposase InsO family protein
MPWKEVTPMSQREEFVQLALQPGTNMSQLCRRFQISRKTGYKFLNRHLRNEGLQDRSRCPNHRPQLTPEEIEEQVVSLRLTYGAWGGRKLRHHLLALGEPQAPSASTCTQILHRNGGFVEKIEASSKPCQRYEREHPNDLWQMDFKGPFLTGQGPCHPLTILDDHSRFDLQLKACASPTTAAVQIGLIEVFERYGLPQEMLMDNGMPWGGGRHCPYTGLSVWLIQLGIRVTHGRPYHPQTQGKLERFHRTLKAEALQNRFFSSLDECQAAFDRWREIYNQQRPHEALGMTPPVRRYCLSKREYPSSLPPIEYGPADHVRKVQQDGTISFRGQEWFVGHAFYGYPVAVRPQLTEGSFDVFFCHQKVVSIDLKHPRSEALKV